jgi:hypothetical protein
MQKSYMRGHERYSFSSALSWSSPHILEVKGGLDSEERRDGRSGNGHRAGFTGYGGRIEE